MGMTSSPCHNCAKRRVGCHVDGQCEAWDEYKRIHEEERLLNAKRRKEFAHGADYLHERAVKRRKKK